MRILFITPHLSTGGLPKYLLEKIKSLQDFDIYLVEYQYLSSVNIVQRNELKNLLGNKFYTLGENKQEITQIIQNISPQIVHFEEIPEIFCNYKITKSIYANQSYKIIETTHTSTFPLEKKRFFPDKFWFVCEYSAQQYERFRIPFSVFEYPIKDLTPNKISAQKALGLDTNKKHVLNVGIWTEGKNQKRIIEIARELTKKNVCFHFVGSLAQNFSDYWKPLIGKSPKNCVIWNERNDTDLFYQACDLFLFTSTHELNPLVVKEALSWKMPVLLNNLPVYLNKFNDIKGIKYLENNEKDIYNIKELLSV